MIDNRTTELLRKLLEERGEEWSETANSIGCVFTWYESAYFGEVGVMDNGDGYLYFNELNGVCLTPEQAIAATLGSGTCEQVIVDCDDGLMPPFTAHCSACGAQWGFTMKYCYNCGAKCTGTRDERKAVKR